MSNSSVHDVDTVGSGCCLVFGVAILLCLVRAWLFPEPPLKPVKPIDLSSENIGRHTGRAAKGFTKGFVKGVLERRPSESEVKQ